MERFSRKDNPWRRGISYIARPPNGWTQFNWCS